jgi:hypothetical protein
MSAVKGGGVKRKRKIYNHALHNLHISATNNNVRVVDCAISKIFTNVWLHKVTNTLVLSEVEDAN